MIILITLYFPDSAETQAMCTIMMSDDSNKQEKGKPSKDGGA